MTGQAFPPAVTAGRTVQELRIDLDASVVIAHSEKEQATPTFKGTFGFHPMLATLDNTGEFLAAQLRPGNAGANNAADHIAVLDAALAQIPDEHRFGTPILVRADTAGATKAFLAHLVGLREQGMTLDFSVGWRLGQPGNAMHAAIAAQPDRLWEPAIDTDNELAEHAGVVELTAQLLSISPRALADYPPGMRIIVRRERPHPGAQLDLFENSTGWRYTAFATTSRIGQLAALDARHRAHARVEDRIRCAKDTGMRRFPSREFAINTAWLTAVMIAVDLTRLGPDPRPARPTRPDQGRTEDAALPATAHRRPHHPRTTTDPATHRPHLALGHRPRPRLQPRPRPATTRNLTPIPRPDQSSGAPGTRRPGAHRCPLADHSNRRSTTSKMIKNSAHVNNRG